MAYNFNVIAMQKAASLNGATDVVLQVTLRCTNTDTNKHSDRDFVLNVDNVGSDAFFTAYADLTEATVLSWVTGGDYADEISVMEEETENPTVSVDQPDPLPWD